MSDTRLEQLLFPPPPDLPAAVRGVPDWAEVHRQLKGKGVTLFLLWQECQYRSNTPQKRRSKIPRLHWCHRGNRCFMFPVFSGGAPMIKLREIVMIHELKNQGLEAA